MKPTTLEEALKLVPEYILLRPGVDVWQKGDEYTVTVSGGYSWELVDSSVLGKSFIPNKYAPIGSTVSGRRPIPQEVREAIAYNMEHDRNSPDVFKRFCPFEAWLASQGGDK